MAHHIGSGACSHSNYVCCDAAQVANYSNDSDVQYRTYVSLLNDIDISYKITVKCTQRTVYVSCGLAESAIDVNH